MIALGIDPGTARLGFGFVQLINNRLNPVDFGCITTSPNARLPDRLLKIHTELDALIKKFQPH